MCYPCWDVGFGYTKFITAEYLPDIMRSMRYKTVLITGGLGFVGTNIASYFYTHTNYRLKIFDRPLAPHLLRVHPVMKLGKRVTFVPGDLLQKSTIAHAVKDSDYIIHLAARTHARESLADPTNVFETNVMGTAYFLEDAKKYGVRRFIQFSSCEVYGNHIRGIRMDESHPLRPVTPYAASKVAGDRLAYAYWESYGLPVVIVRPFNMYGPYQTPDKMIPLFIKRLLANETVLLNNGGRSKRDFISVFDVASAVLRLMTAPEQDVCGQVYNIGLGRETSVKDVAYLIADLLHKPVSLIQPQENNVTETMDNKGISKKVEKSLRWKPAYSFRHGLKETVSWYLKHQDWLGNPVVPGAVRP